MMYDIVLYFVSGQDFPLHNVKEQTRTTVVEAMKDGSVAAFRDAHGGLHMVDMAKVTRLTIDER